LQQEPRVYRPGVYAEFDLLGMRLGIFCPKDAFGDEFGDSRGGRMSICWEVEDLEGALAHLRAIGHGPVAAVERASHGREIFVHDPDGNRLILHQSTANTNPLR
jgi:catechol 2,3-dioxygenase-like lactoylglutathione lyase family enzyme